MNRCKLAGKQGAAHGARDAREHSPNYIPEHNLSAHVDALDVDGECDPVEFGYYKRGYIAAYVDEIGVIAREQQQAARLNELIAHFSQEHTENLVKKRAKRGAS